MRYVAFLRGGNSGGTGLFSMADLQAACSEICLSNVRTHSQSGNILFESFRPEKELIEELERVILPLAGKKIPIVIRTDRELEKILVRNPFPGEDGAKIGVMLLPKEILQDQFGKIDCPTGERAELAGREIYVFYPNGLERSKLIFPKLSQAGTMRNIKTIRKIIELFTQ